MIQVPAGMFSEQIAVPVDVPAEMETSELIVPSRISPYLPSVCCGVLASAIVVASVSASVMRRSPISTLMFSSNSTSYTTEMTFEVISYKSYGSTEMWIRSHSSTRSDAPNSLVRSTYSVAMLDVLAVEFRAMYCCAYVNNCAWVGAVSVNLSLRSSGIVLG